MATVTSPPNVENGASVMDEKKPLEATAESSGTRSRADSDAESFHSTAEDKKDIARPQEEEFKLPTDGPLKVPLPKPTTNPPKPAPLTSDQEIKYATVLSKVSAWKTIPSDTTKKATQVPLEDSERMWLTRECLLRYLRATKWVTAQALNRLQSTLSWRREYGADNFTFDYISPENETGKQVILGYDNDARPCLYLNPGKQNTEVSDRQIHHLCFMLDRTVDMMPPGQENACLIIHFKGASTGKIPSVSQARQVLNILQGHNPERLGRALISELPWYVNTFFKLIAPFIDPVTREKMKFNPDIRAFVPPDRLWKEHKGDLNFEYDHPVYWKALEQECTARRNAMRQRWEKAGSQIGEYEEYLRGGDHPSLKEEVAAGGSLPPSEKASEKGVEAGMAGLKV